MEWTSTEPFPHVIADGLINQDYLDEALREMQFTPDRLFGLFDNDDERKRYIPWHHAGPAQHNLMHQHIALRADIGRLCELRLLYDPNMTGGGCHRIDPGGYLNKHVDSNIHERVGYRRVNMLTYLNRDWTEAEGGVLELGSQDPVRVLPEFGRTVIFPTTSTSWHGHGPVTGDRTRWSFACYFYTSKPPAEFDEPRSTVFA